MEKHLTFSMLIPDSIILWKTNKNFALIPGSSSWNKSGRSCLITTTRIGQCHLGVRAPRSPSRLPRPSLASALHNTGGQALNFSPQLRTTTSCGWIWINTQCQSRLYYPPKKGIVITIKAFVCNIANYWYCEFNY